MAKQLKIYVASSWRNVWQPSVVYRLKARGYQVYDYMDSEGFHWSEVDPYWQGWANNVVEYIRGLQHPRAIQGFNRDMNALKECDVCVYVMPCGVSASFEAGWACGAGKPVVVYVPNLKEPELMVKMANLITYKWEDVVSYLAGLVEGNNG